MVSTAITGNNFFMVNAGTETKSVDVIEPKKNSFDDIMSSVSKEPDKAAETNKSDVKAEEIRNLFRKDAVVNKTEENEISEEEFVENMQEIVADFVQKVMNVIEENFEVTQDEVVEAMDELGFMAKDILEGNGLSELVVELKGKDNVMELLTDTDLSKMLKDAYAEIKNLFDDFVNQMGIEKEEIMQLLSDTDTTKMAEMLDDMLNHMPVQNESDAAKEVLNTDSDEIILDKAKENVTNKPESANAEASNETAEGEVKSTIDNSPDKSEAFTHSKDTRTDVNQSQVQSFNNIISESIGIDNEAVMDVEPEQIIRQIVEEIRTVVKGDMTSMEMQLNPEHLGKVTLQIVSKNGEITAQIYAQNDVVKEAIESQVSQLKENLIEQGVKVESIEVMVGSRQFDENFDGHNESKQENNHKKHISKKELDEINGVVSVTESIEEEIMKQDGNTVSIRA